MLVYGALLLCLLASDINIYSNVMHAWKDQTFSHKSKRQPSWVYQKEDMRQTAEGTYVYKD